MLTLLLKDRGSKFHSKITEEDYQVAKNELNGIGKCQAPT